MNTTTGRLGESLRIVWAITTKDITDGIKNRTTLAIILSVLFMMVFYTYVPDIFGSDTLPRLVVHDAGSSSLMSDLEGSTGFELRQALSQEGMERYVGDTHEGVLGLVIPADFDHILASGSVIGLEGYVVHWASDSDVGEVKGFFEQELSELTGQPVRINVEGNVTYPDRDSVGRSFRASLSVVYAAVLVGMSLVPTLMIEEKRTHTIDALLVSPASAGQIVIGKALTGLFYSALASGVALAFNLGLVTHWGLAVAAVVLGSLFTIGLGLLTGSVAGSKQTGKMMGLILMLPLLMPVALLMARGLFPESVLAVFDLVPTVAMSALVRASFSASVTLADVGSELALVVVSAVVVLALVVRLVRRSDR